MRQVFFLAHCERPAPSGRRLLHEEKINEQSNSLSSPAKRRYQRMNPINSDISLHATSNEISKPNRAQGRAGAMRQVFFLAHCGRPAQSGRQLLHEEKIHEQSNSLSSSAIRNDCYTIQPNPHPYNSSIKCGIIIGRHTLIWRVH